MSAVSLNLESLWKTLWRFREWLFAIPLAILAGVAVAFADVLVLPLAIALVGLMLTLIYGRRLFWIGLIFLLAGYMFGGRGFAYVGFFPLYIGEAILGLGILCVAILPFTNRVTVSFRFVNWSLIPLGIFCVWQFLQTLPYLPRYQFDAIRDAMMYIYALYAVLIAMLIPWEWVNNLFKRWGRLLVPFIFAVPVIYMFMTVIPFPIRFPGAPAPLIAVKYGDIGCHLGGAAAFLLLGLDRRERPWPRTLVWVLWMVWIVGWMMFGSSNRGGMLAAVCAVAGTLLVWPVRAAWYRPFMVLLIALWLLLVTNAYSELSFQAGKGREISAQQIVDNFVSIFASGDNDGGLEGTKEWRLNWWGDIINYTFRGPYFWTGKGYGVNLAVDDGYAVGEGEALRSPHNSHMNYLARSGVPGFVLWCIFLVVHLGRLLVIAITERNRHPWAARYATWLLAYSGAFLVNGSFDLMLESPFAAIWFWSLTGFSWLFFSQRAEDDNPDDFEAQVALS